MPSLFKKLVCCIACVIKIRTNATPAPTLCKNNSLENFAISTYSSLSVGVRYHGNQGELKEGERN